MRTNQRRPADYNERRRLAHRYEQENRLTPDALTGGDWVRTGLKWRWVAAEPASLCGTDSGYFRHRRSLKEAACMDCKRAHTAAEQARRGRAA